MSIGHDRFICSKFRHYLMDRCGLKYSTATKYIWSLNLLSKYLNDTKIFECSLYDIKSVHYLLDLKTKLAESEVFRIANSSCKGNLVPSLRHYYDFMASSKDSDHTRNSHIRVAYQRG